VRKCNYARSVGLRPIVLLLTHHTYLVQPLVKFSAIRQCPYPLKPHLLESSHLGDPVLELEVELVRPWERVLDAHADAVAVPCRGVISWLVFF